MMYGMTETILDSEDMRELAKRAKNGDIEAEDMFIRHSIKYILRTGRTILDDTKIHTWEDIVIAGMMGIRVALAKFDETKGATPLTYARHWVKCHMRREYRVVNNVITPPLCPATPQAVRNSNIAKNVMYASDLEFDTIGCESGIEDICKKEAKLKLMELIDDLPARTAYIIKQVYFQERSNTSIAKELDCSHERVRQIKNAALVTLREKCKTAEIY